MTNLNNHSTSNTSEEPELSMEELDAKWDALENDPEYLQTLRVILNTICTAHREKMRKNETNFRKTFT